MRGLIAVFALCCLSVTFGEEPETCPPGVEETYTFTYDCRKYWECDNGTKIEGKCQTGLFYNDMLHSCDPIPYPPCYSCPSGSLDYFPLPYDCTAYIECYMGQAEIVDCIPPLWFNRFKKTCTDPEDSECGPYSTTSSPTWTTPEASDCMNNPAGFIYIFPDPYDCQAYHECIGADLFNFTCPPGLLFDANRHLCDLPDLVTCTGTTTAVPPSTATTIDPRCADGDGFYPMPDCSEVLLCDNGYAYLLTCPPNLLFDMITESCVNPPYATCGYTTTSSTQTTGTPDVSCIGQPDGTKFPYFGECHMYYICINGLLYVEECPNDLWFNDAIKQCDYPYNTDCPWARK